MKYCIYCLENDAKEICVILHLKKIEDNYGNKLYVVFKMFVMVFTASVSSNTINYYYYY